MKDLQENQTVVNGFDTSQLGGLIGNLKEHPEAGNVTFLCNSRWQNGARVFNQFSGYQIDGQSVHEGEREFVVLSDEPSEFGASDAAPGPAEQLLGAVSGCISATTNAFAVLNEIELEKLEVTVEGDINLQGMFALRDDVQVGFNALRIKMQIAGKAPEIKLKEMAESGFKYSPIRNTVSNGAPVALAIHIEDS